MTTVSTVITYEVASPATLVLQVAAVHAAEENLTVDGAGDAPVEVLPGTAGGRQHVVRVPPGTLTVRYAATIRSAPAPPPVGAAERVEALRPSRYCPSDRVAGLARSLFRGKADPAERVAAVCDHVRGEIVYAPGCSGPSTDGVETLLAGEGVCRDFAHVVAMLCRAVDVPARVASVYAPGLSPMDLHAVAETELDGQWWVWDATGLAPRQTLARIATGRDAADTAFVSVLSGEAALQGLEVMAVASGRLPGDDHQGPVQLP
ncbi:MAG TPA: transglutaminase family protein [Mycobacteriales bacterium]|jgi:transglutaminase-like putative cysteine protease